MLPYNQDNVIRTRTNLTRTNDVCIARGWGRYGIYTPGVRTWRCVNSIYIVTELSDIPHLYNYTMGYVAMTMHLQCSNNSISYKNVKKLPATINTIITIAARERRRRRTTVAKVYLGANLTLTYKQANFMASASAKHYQQVFLLKSWLFLR